MIGAGKAAMTAGSTPPSTDRALGERLVAAGRISREQLAALLAEQAARGGTEKVRLGALLLEKGIVGDTPAATSPGARRIGNYIIDREIGRGAMGVVYRGH